MNKDNIQIFVVINHKFSNHLIPILPDLVIAYLIDHKDKVKYYFDSNINVSDILKSISTLSGEVNIMDEVIKYVEHKDV